MEKLISVLKKTFLVSGIIFSMQLILAYFHVENDFTTNFSTITFFIFIASFYPYLIASDIQKNKFNFLNGLNHVSLATSLLFFALGILYDGYMSIVYSAYVIVFAFANLIVMSIIYCFKKTGGKYFFKEWLLFFGVIVLYILFVIVRRKL